MTGRRRRIPAFLPAAAAAVFGLIGCQGRALPPPPVAATGPPAIPDAQPAVDAPLFLGQNAFPAPLPGQADFAPVLATMRADGGNSGVADGPAPLGRAPVTGSAAIALQPPLLWDPSGDLTAGCHVELAPGLVKDCLAAVDASTLAVAARWTPPGQDLNLTTAVVDASERIIVTTRQGHLFVISRPDAAGTFTVARDIDVSGHLVAGQALRAAVPDGSGNLWFNAGGPGPDATVGYVTANNEVVTATLANQAVETGFAVDQGNVFLATAPAGAADRSGAPGYVFDLAADAGQVQTVWRAAYDAGSAIKPGGTTRGTASSVALLGSQYLAVADNADDQAHLLVFLRGTPPPARTTTTVGATTTIAVGATTTTTAVATTTTAVVGATTTTTVGGATATTLVGATTTTTVPAESSTSRLVCRVGLFSPGASAVTSAPIAYSSGTSNSVIVANGLNAPPPLASPSDGGPVNSIDQMAPGVARIDVAADGSGCQTTWSIPLRLKTSPVLSGTTGLIYGYTEDETRAAAGTYIWYFVAVDYRTGRVVWQQRAGAGSTKNDNRQAMVLGANGVLYQTVPLGLVWMRDVAQRP